MTTMEGMESINYSFFDNMDYENFSKFMEEMDYSDMMYIGERKVVPHWEAIVKITVYAVIIIAAIIGNVLIIVVVVKNKRMRTTTNFFIVNLAVADLLVTAFCTWVHVVDNLTEGWVLGTFFCKMNSFTQVVALVASIFSLLLIACDRFFGIVFAMKAHIIERKASHSIVILWICSIAVGAPMLFVRQMESITWKDHVETWCGDKWTAVVTTDEETGRQYNTFPGKRAYYTVITVVLYFLPMVVMSCVYVIIIVTVWFSQSPGERLSKEVQSQSRVKRKVVMMLVIILATFGQCWLPLQVTILYKEYQPATAQMEDWWYILKFVSYTLAFSNSALNPLIYAGFNENFRGGFRALFGCYERKCYSTAMSRADSMYSSTTMTKV